MSPGLNFLGGAEEGLEYELGPGLGAFAFVSDLGGATFSLPVFDPVALLPGFIWFLYWLLLRVGDPLLGAIAGLLSGLASVFGCCLLLELLPDV